MKDFKIEDLEGAGQYLVANKNPYIINTGMLTTIMFKVGYVFLDKENKHCCALIAMSDGLISFGHYKDGTLTRFNGERVEEAKEKLVNYLNNPPTNVEYRFATREEVLRVVNYQEGRWVGK